MKSFLSLVLFLLFLGTSSQSFAQSQLSEEGCNTFAQVVSRMFLAYQANPKLKAQELEKVVHPEDEKRYEQVPEDIKELVNLSAEVLIHDGPNYKVDEVFEGVQGFCYRREGDVQEMIKVFKQVLKKTDI